MKHWSNGMMAILVSALLALAACAAPVAPAPPAGSSPVAATPDYAQARVSYLGPEGTYTQEACALFFADEGTYLPQEDVASSVRMLKEGTADFAVIPQENTIGGAIGEYLDEIVGDETLAVVGEVELSINQNLLAKPGAALAGIERVYSHKQGIAQGTAWLAEHLPEAEVIEVSSTAEGARLAAEDGSGASAAIGSAAAAEVYGLEVTAEAIQMNSANKTRFYVLVMADPAAEPSDRMAFTASGDAGDLAELLESAENLGLEIVAVHDRPEKTELGRYTYLVECTGGGSDAFVALERSRPEFDLSYLGSFPLVAR